MSQFLSLCFDTCLFFKYWGIQSLEELFSQQLNLRPKTFSVQSRWVRQLFAMPTPLYPSVLRILVPPIDQLGVLGCQELDASRIRIQALPWVAVDLLRSKESVCYHSAPSVLPKKGKNLPFPRSSGTSMWKEVPQNPLCNLSAGQNRG